jgi:cell division protein FtsB
MKIKMRNVRWEKYNLRTSNRSTQAEIQAKSEELNVLEKGFHDLKIAIKKNARYFLYKIVVI